MWWSVLAVAAIIAFTVNCLKEIEHSSFKEYLCNGGLLQMLLGGVFTALFVFSLNKYTEEVENNAVEHYIHGDYETVEHYDNEGNVDKVTYKLIPTDYN